MNSFLNKLFSKPLILIAIVTLISILFLPFALRVKPNNSLEANAIQTDPSYYRLMEMQKTFNVSEENLSIAIHSSNSLMTANNLAYLENLRKALASLPHISQVIAVTNLSEIKVENNEILIEPLLPDQKKDLSAEEIHKIANHPLYKPLFISEDAKTTLFVILLKPLGKDNVARTEILNGISSVFKRFEREDIKFLLTGSTYLMHRANQEIDKDNQTLMPLTFVLLLILLYFIYRRVSFVILPFVVTILAIEWTIGVMGIWGKQLTAFTTLVPLVLLTICLCDAVHILNIVWRESIDATPGKSRKQIVITALAGVLLPSTLASIDNMIGFIALMTSGMEAIREMGALISVGVLFAFVLSIIVIPVSLFYVPLKTTPHDIRSFQLFSSIMERLGRFVITRHRAFLLGGFSIILFCAFGLTRIQVGQELWGMFKGETEMQAANDLFKKTDMGASGEIDIVFKGAPGTFLKAETLNSIQELKSDLEHTEFQRKVFSLVDALAWLAGKYHQDGKQEPLTQADIDSGLALLDFYGDAFFSKNEFVTEDGSQYRVKQFILFGDNSPDVLRLESIIRTQIEKHLPPGVQYDVVGRPYIWAHMVHYVVKSQIASFSGAFLLISFIMGLLFKSVRVGLITMIVNFIPIVVVLGLVGWLGIKLNAFIAMVACVALGLAVDDTIHFVLSYRQLLGQGKTPQEALIKSYELVGFQTVITTSLMALGLSTLTFSGLATTTEFGMVFSLTCFFSLMAVLFILPPLLLLIQGDAAKNIKPQAVMIAAQD